MKSVHLQFTSFIYLTAFRQYAKASNWQIDLNNLTIRCDCSHKDLQTACKDFRATVITNTVTVMQPNAHALEVAV